MTLEAVIFVIFLGASFAIGAIAARSIKGLSDYFVAGARMPWYFLTGTFLASNVSAGLFLGATNMNAQHGYAMWCAYFTTAIGFVLAIAVVGVLVRRLASRYEIYDFSDVLATRYNSRPGAIRTVSTVVLPIVYVPMLAAQLIALATIGGSVLDVSYETALTIVALIVIAYTLLGGMLGVVWTDGFQFIVLLVGLLVAVPIAMTSIGDSDPVVGWERLRALSTDNFRWSSENWPWVLVLGQLTWIFALPVQPHLVTRFLTAESERQILIALPICLTVGLIIYISTVPLGLAGRVAEPVLQPGGYYYLIVARDLLGPWLGGFALAGIAAAALSTCSTALMVTGQQLSRDVYQKWLAKDADERHSLFAARVAILLIGLVTFLIAYVQWLGIFWLVVLSASFLAAIFFVPVFAGFFWSQASAEGALAAMIGGGLTALGVFLLNEALDANYFVSELFAGLGVSAITMWWVSRRYPASPAERAIVDELLAPDEEGSLSIEHS